MIARCYFPLFWVV